MIRTTLNPGFRTGLHQKDLSLVPESARTPGLSLPNTAMVRQMSSVCVASRGTGWNHSTLMHALKILIIK